MQLEACWKGDVSTVRELEDHLVSSGIVGQVEIAHPAAAQAADRGIVADNGSGAPFLHHSSSLSPVEGLDLSLTMRRERLLLGTGGSR